MGNPALEEVAATLPLTSAEMARALLAALLRLEPADPPAALSPDAAAEFCGFGRTAFDDYERKGLIGPEPLRVGNKLLYSRAELAKWLDYGAPRRDKWAKLWPKLRGPLVK